MATITVYDQVTGNTRTIGVDIGTAVLAAGPDGERDYYITLNTSARTVDGDNIPTLIITGQDDLVLGTTQYDQVTSTAYAHIEAAIDDYVLRMIKGIPGDSGSAMSFS